MVVWKLERKEGTDFHSHRLPRSRRNKNRVWIDVGPSIRQSLAPSNYAMNAWRQEVKRNCYCIRKQEVGKNTESHKRTNEPQKPNEPTKNHPIKLPRRMWRVRDTLIHLSSAAPCAWRLFMRVAFGVAPLQKRQSGFAHMLTLSSFVL